MTQKLCILTRKNQEGFKIIFFSKDNKVLNFLLPEDSEKEQWDPKIKLVISIANKGIGVQGFSESYFLK